MKTTIGSIEFRLRFVDKWYIEARQGNKQWTIVKSVPQQFQPTKDSAADYFIRFTNMMHLQNIYSAVARRLSQAYGEGTPAAQEAK